MPTTPELPPTDLCLILTVDLKTAEQLINERITNARIAPHSKIREIFARLGPVGQDGWQPITPLSSILAYIP